MPEIGPNMMWNTKYGLMAGSMMGPGRMMGGWWGGQGQQTPTVDTPVTRDQALQSAQQFLGSFMPGTSIGEVHYSNGYRTIDVERDGTTVGMLSVSGYNGALWYHIWHDDFLDTWRRPT